MKRYYCTYFDRNYLIKALALMDSLNRQEKNPFTLYAVCLDELSRVLLTRLAPPNVVAVPLHEIERGDDGLAAARQNRTLVEYYWTLTPTVILTLLQRLPGTETITYLDADLYFYSSPDPIFDELGDHSILIHGHRFSPALAHLEAGNGAYNVGLLCFRNDHNGLEALSWWRDRCNEWCYHRSEDGKMGDQMYLNDWSCRFKGVKVLEHKGAGVAPWNHEQYDINRSTAGQVMIDELPLVFYHFHAFFFVNPDIIIPANHLHYSLSEEILRLCFLPYVCMLRHMAGQVQALLPSFTFGLVNENLLTADHTFLCNNIHSEQIAKSAQLPSPTPLDGEWDCFCSIQFRPGIQRLVEAPITVAPLWTPDRKVRSCDDLFLELEDRSISAVIETLYIIGAHLFQERDIFFNLFPTLKKLYLFEPIPDLHEYLRESTRQDQRIEVFPFAIADMNGTTQFHITDNQGESSSLLHLGKHREIFPHVDEAGSITVECRTLDSVIDQYRLEEPDLLFIDVQGAEYKVLSSLSQRLRSRVKLIYTEASTEELYVGARPLNDIRDLLSADFCFLGFAPLFNDTPMHGNALFVNHGHAGLLDKGAGSNSKGPTAATPPVDDTVVNTLHAGKGGEYLVSAIVSSYNAEQFMQECMEDLENQTIFEQLEIIVIDAASTQSEGAIVADFQKRYSNITYVRTGTRIGVYSAWNMAIRLAKGRYITPFSTNDRLRRDAYEIMAAALEHNRETALVYGDSYHTRIPHETFENHTRCGAFQWPDYAYQDLLTNCMIGPHPMWRTSVHESVGFFDESFSALGDQDFFIRLGAKYDMLHIPQFTGLYWISNDGLSNRKELYLPEIQKIRQRYVPNTAVDSNVIALETRGANPDGTAARVGMKRLKSLAVAKKEERRYEESFDLFLKVCSVGDMSVLADLGDCLANQGRMDEAAGYYRDALKHDSDNVQAHLGIGVKKLMTGKYSEAAISFNKALRCKPDDVKALCGLGMARSGQGRHSEGFELFKKALGMNPDNLTALHELLKGAYELDRLSEAEAYLTGYLMYHPADSHILFSLAGLRYRLGNYVEALDSLERVLAFEPTYEGGAELAKRARIALDGADGEVMLAAVA